MLERWPDAYQAYTEATEILPKYFVVWLERGRLNTKLGRWDSAASDFAKAVSIGCPVERADLSGVPQVLLYAGESTAYEQLCEQLRRSTKDDPMSVAIRGQLVGDLSESYATELAERGERMLAASHGEDNSGSELSRSSVKLQHKFRDMYYGANLYVAGWAHLRAGDHVRALQRLEESNHANWFGRGIAHPLIAIAHHRAGNAEEALRSFEQSQALLDRLLDESVGRSAGSPSIPWIDWIEFLLNHREASIVVKGHTPATDARLTQLSSFAEAAIAN